MKKFILTLMIAAGATLTFAQVGKGNKALEAKDYKAAKAAFESAIASDPNDASAHLGLSRYYAIAATGERDNYKAIDHVAKAEAIFNGGDLKLQAKLEKDEVTLLTLKERRDRVEAAILEDVKKENTIAAYTAFLEKFPNSSVARPAANYRDELAFAEATKTGTEQGWNEFLKLYPTSEKLKDATQMRNKVASEYALKINTEEVYAAYVKNYPDAIQAPQMQQRLYAVAFENAKAKNTVEAYDEFIRVYPESVFVMQAKERLEQLREAEGGN